jgi:rod shape-determining protein MreD
MIRHVIVIGLVLVTALLLQSTLFGQLTLLGVRPELVYMVTILFALIEGPAEGTIVGFAGGLFQDFLLNDPKGITALTLTVLGYTIGLSRQYIASPSPLLPTIVVAVGTAAGVAFHSVVSFLLGQFDHPFTFTVKVILLTALYGAVLTPIVYPAIVRLTARTRPQRVVRF